MDTSIASPPPDRDTLINYLRNRQKAAEIESKVNGVNIWVLLGATAVVAWQFLRVFEKWTGQTPEFALRTCLLTQAAYFLLILRVDSRPDEARFFWPESSPSFASLVQAVLIVLPSVALLALVGGSPLAILLCVVFAIGLALAFTRMVAAAWLPGKKAIFPAVHSLKVSPKTDQTLTIVIGVLLIALTVNEVKLIARIAPNLDLTAVQNVALALSLYWLVSLLLFRRGRYSALDWTYELETDLLLGNVSNTVALRHIEHRYLGRRLGAVMDEFFDGLDERLTRLSANVKAFRDESAAIGNIPHEYPTERAARMRHGSQAAMKELQALAKAHRQYTDYIEQFTKNPFLKRRAVVLNVLRSMTTRHATYVDRTEKLMEELSSILDGLRAPCSTSASPSGVDP